MALSKSEVEPYIHVDTTVYPSLMVGDRRIERIGLGHCECGRPIGLFVERKEGPYRSMSAFDSMGGRKILWRSNAKCPSCMATDALVNFKPTLRTRKLDRGVHRAAVAEVIRWCAEKRTRMGDLEVEILSEIQASSTTEWIPSAAFTSHNYAGQLAPIVTNLMGSSGPPDALFPVGRVQIEIPRGFTLHDQAVLPLLDRHARGDCGQNGELPDSISQAAQWCPSLASLPEQNRISVAANDGPVRSLYIMPETINGHRFSVEVCTFLEGQQAATTYVLAAVG